jgi:hypothetical protein
MGENDAGREGWEEYDLGTCEEEKRREEKRRERI